MKKDYIIDVCKTHTYPIYIFQNDTLIYEPDSRHMDYTLLPLDVIIQKKNTSNQKKQASYELQFLADNHDEILTSLNAEDLPLFFITSTNMTKHNSIIIGPLASGLIDFKTWHTFSKKIALPHSADYRVKIVNPHIVINILTVLHELLANTTITFLGDELPFFEDTASTFPQSFSQEKTPWSDFCIEHTSYQLETNFIKCIGEGRLEEALKLSAFFDKAKVGKVSENSFKQEEYMSVVGITLYTRAVIEQGVSPEKAYSISDYYMKKLSAAKNISELKLLSRQALETFVSILKENETKILKSVHIENAMNYINHHLRSPLTLTEISHAIGLSSSHLSSLFQKYEGISIKQYILENKLKAVANMLRFSNCEVGTIAEYFYFSSSSHLGTAFRKQYGCTPSEYRKKYFSSAFSEHSQEKL